MTNPREGYVVSWPAADVDPAKIKAQWRATLNASPIACESRIKRVTVYARGAVVARRLSLPPELPEGAADLTVSGITAFAEPGSLRAVADSDRAIVALRSKYVIPRPPVVGGSIAERVRAHHLAKQRLLDLRHHLAGRREVLAAITLDPSMASQWRRVDPTERVGDAIALSKLLSREIEALDGRVREADEELVRIQRELERDEIEAAQARSSEIDGEGQVTLDVLLRVAPGKASAVRALDIEYVVQPARWFPAYSARFSAAATRVDWSIEALVAQASGEDWSHVELALSTADLVTDARLPELASLRLGRAQPPARRGYRAAPEGLDALFQGYDTFVKSRPPPASRQQRLEAASFGDTLAAKPTATLASVEIAEEQLLDEELGAAEDEPAPEVHVARSKGGLFSAFQGAPPQQAKERAAYADMPSAPPAFGGGGPPPPAAAAPLPASFAAPVVRSRSVPAAKSLSQARSSAAFDAEGGAGPAFEPAAPTEIEPDDAWLDFDALHLKDPSDQASRGRLVRDDASSDRARRAAADALWLARGEINQLTPPPHAKDPRSGRGYFDYRYDAEGLGDIPSNGRLQRVPVAMKSASAAPRFTTVPREAPEVYREVEIRNPFQAPLLAGPVEVFVDGALLTQSAIAHVDQGGNLLLGLGVEDRLRVARNARVEEGSAGLLGGSTTVEHTITIDLSSSLGRDVDVVVIDRVPVTDDKDIEIKTLFTKPAGEVYTQAERGDPIRRGMRWSVPVSAGGKAKVELGYRITLPAKNEIVGGNRREG